MVNQQLSPLERARAKIYEIAGGSIDSHDVRAARLTTAQRIDYFRSPEFRDWVASEKAAGREVFWLKDVDKTQAAGDIFTFFFKWRADNNKFSRAQLKVIRDALLKRRKLLSRAAARAAGAFSGAGRQRAALAAFAAAGPHEVLRLWQQKEMGGSGLGLLDFWSEMYWPSQLGLTREEKQAQVAEFIPIYAAKVYPGVPEENRLLEEIGVNVVIVSNGDQELAIAAGSVLGVKPENVVGSHLIYGEDGRATGVNHSYEVFDEDWVTRPQPGKALSFHYWIHTNRSRWGWQGLDDRKIVIAGRDGDSASSDGGMMILLPPAAIGNFMIDTPGEPERLQKFYSVAAKYGWTRGQFFTLIQSPSQSGRFPE
jgi:hypothetical protein